MSADNFDVAPVNRRPFRRPVRMAATWVAAAAVGIVVGQSAGRLILSQWLNGAPPPNVQPVAALEWTQWDFGAVEPGSVLKTELPVTNAGGKSLILLEHQSNCGCRSAGELERTVIGPGGSATLTLEWRTGDSRGAVRKQFRYTTNMREQPLIAVTLFADVQASPPDRPNDIDGQENAESDSQAQ